MPVNTYKRKSVEKPKQNPIWRGIGCIIMILLPLVTFGLTVLFTPMIAATGLPPTSLVGRVNLPGWAFQLPVSRDIAIFIWGINNLWLGLIVFFVILLLLSGISSVIYTAVLQVIGPPRYGEMDVPPSTYKPKKYTR